MKFTVTKTMFLSIAALMAVLSVRSATAFASDATCSNLDMVWHDPLTGTIIRSEPYVCGSDLCGGYRCKEGTEISPACYNAAECPAACAGECVYIPTAQLDCATLCTTAPCGIEMTWYKNRTLLRSEPYECELDTCAGFRCLNGLEISPACYSASQCAKSCRKGTCVDIPNLQARDCNATLCSMN